MRARKLIALAVLLGLPLPAWSAGGGSPFAFLLLPTDARPVALGGAYTAAVQDSNAVFHNPAGLAELPRGSASFMHNAYFEGVSQEALSIGFKSGWGFGLNYVSYGDIPRTTISNQTGAGLGSYGARDLAASAGYGRRMNAFLLLGASLKYVQSEIAGYSANGAALDLGGLVQLEPLFEGLPLTLGWSVQNLGLRKPRYHNTKEDFPTYIRLGAAYGLSLGTQKILAVLDINKAVTDELTLHPGMEYRPIEAFAVRAGFDGRNDAGPGFAAGAAWHFRDISLNYGFMPFGELGESHRISIGLRFGAARGAPRVTKWRPYERSSPSRPGYQPRRKSPKAAPKQRRPVFSPYLPVYYDDEG